MPFPYQNFKETILFYLYSCEIYLCEHDKKIMWGFEKRFLVVDFRPKSQYRVWKLGKVCPTFLTFNLYPSLQSVTTGDGKQSKARFKRHISAEWNYECVTSTIQEQMRYFDFAFHSTFLFLHSTARIFRTQHLLLSVCRASSHSASENRADILSKKRSVWCIIVDLYFLAVLAISMEGSVRDMASKQIPFFTLL